MNIDTLCMNIDTLCKHAFSHLELILWNDQATALSAVDRFLRVVFTLCQVARQRIQLDYSSATMVSIVAGDLQAG